MITKDFLDSDWLVEIDEETFEHIHITRNSCYLYYENLMWNFDLTVTFPNDSLSYTFGKSSTAIYGLRGLVHDANFDTLMNGYTLNFRFYNDFF